MLVAKGTIVRLKRTGEEGVVTQIVDDEMVRVMLKKDGMIIPAFMEDLERVDKSTSKGKAKIAKKPAKKTGQQAKVQSQYTILKSLGIQLAFDSSASGSTQRYEIFLINDTRYDVVYDIKIVTREQRLVKTDGVIKTVAAESLGFMLADTLNEYPVVEIKCQQVTTEGIGARLEKTVKVKPQQFFKRIKTAPLLNRPTHLYQLFPSFDQPKGDKEDLQSYTKRQAVVLTEDDEHYRLYDLPSPKDLAEFDPELDLHIEKLVEDTSKLTKADMLKIQLQHFHKFLEKAIELGVQRVFIIHGVGKGKLRNEIAAQLLLNPDVKTFKNEYHPYYGHGATEVLFN